MTSRCEVCQARPATYLACSPCGGDRCDPSWQAVCDHDDCGGWYTLRLDDVRRDPIRWMAHLSEKRWMDWPAFAHMMHRLAYGWDFPTEDRREDGVVVVLDEVPLAPLQEHEKW